MSEEITCSSCERQASWAVTLPYEEGDTAGELTAYCDRCREEHSEVVTSIPLDILDEEAFVGLYSSGMTRTDPGIATRVLFGSEMPSLADRARHAIPPDPSE